MNKLETRKAKEFGIKAGKEKAKRIYQVMQNRAAQEKRRPQTPYEIARFLVDNHYHHHDDNLVVLDGLSANIEESHEIYTRYKYGFYIGVMQFYMEKEL